MQEYNAARTNICFYCFIFIEFNVWLCLYLYKSRKKKGIYVIIAKLKDYNCKQRYFFFFFFSLINVNKLVKSEKINHDLRNFTPNNAIFK